MTSIISVANVVVSESDLYAEFIVTLDAPSTEVVTVNYATSTFTSAGRFTADFVPIVSDTLTFAVGETSKTIQVSIVNDTIAELMEDFYLTLSTPSANAVLGNDVATANIIDNDTTAAGRLHEAPPRNHGREASRLNEAAGRRAAAGSRGSNPGDGVCDGR